MINIIELSKSSNLAIVVGCHEDSSAALLGRALAAETVDFPIVVHLEISLYCQ